MDRFSSQEVYAPSPLIIHTAEPVKVRLRWPLVISLLLHLLGGLYLIESGDQRIATLSVSKSAPPRVIQATLVASSPPRSTTSAESLPPHAPLQLAPTLEVKQLINGQVELSLPLPELTAKQAPSTAPVASPSSAPAQSRSASRSAAQHVKQLNQQALNELATSEATQRARHKTSPPLPSIESDKFKTEDEKLMERITRHVNCSSTTSKIVGLLSGLAGGTLRCTEPPPLAEFLDKRVKKPFTRQSQRR